MSANNLTWRTWFIQSVCMNWLNSMLHVMTSASRISRHVGEVRIHHPSPKKIAMAQSESPM